MSEYRKQKEGNCAAHHRFLLHLLTVCSSLALAAVSITAALLLAGFRPFLLRSTSMEPLYPKGSLILVNTRVTPEETSIGDVLVYRARDNSLVMHRLVAPDELAGDAGNTVQHITLTRANLVGRASASFYCPPLSWLLEQVLSLPWVFWSLSAALLILSCLPWSSNISASHSSHR